MNEAKLKNWELVKKALEASNKTDTEYYRRAVAICEGKPDPLQ